MSESKCRFCSTKLTRSFIDLGLSPMANSYVKREDLHKGEKFYPLHTYVCENCFLVQLEEFEAPHTIFSDYAYFSSYSESWLRHSKKYVDMIIKRLGLTVDSLVIEVASNDGYLLQYFLERGIPVVGIEPAENIARVAKDKGINTLVQFFGMETGRAMAASGKMADLLLGNNVLAHVPDINDFVAGMKHVLKPSGTITMEFPHLLNLIRDNQFDTIYHEHFSYLSFMTTKAIFESHGLKIYDVEKIPTHGGSIRIFATHRENYLTQITENVEKLLAEEKEFGVSDKKLYEEFGNSVKQAKRNILSFIIDEKNKGKKMVAYGAPAKGNTLLNYCGIRGDMIDYTVDRNPYKEGTFLPGTHIEVKAVEEIKKTKPDYLVILPWNLKEEIMEQNDYIREWGGKFVTLLPKVSIL